MAALLPPCCPRIWCTAETGALGDAPSHTQQAARCCVGTRRVVAKDEMDNMIRHPSLGKVRVSVRLRVCVCMSARVYTFVRACVCVCWEEKGGAGDWPPTACGSNAAAASTGWAVRWACLTHCLLQTPSPCACLRLDPPRRCPSCSWPTRWTCPLRCSRWRLRRWALARGGVKWTLPHPPALPEDISVLLMQAASSRCSHHAPAPLPQLGKHSSLGLNCMLGMFMRRCMQALLMLVCPSGRGNRMTPRRPQSATRPKRTKTQTEHCCHTRGMPHPLPASRPAPLVCCRRWGWRTSRTTPGRSCPPMP